MIFFGVAGKFEGWAGTGINFLMFFLKTSTTSLCGTRR